MEVHNVSHLEMDENDAEAASIGIYLKLLLLKVWEEDECFSGKRPFGNSGWKWDVYQAMVKGGAIDGKLDEEGFLEEVNEEKADKIIAHLITRIMYSPI